MGEAYVTYQVTLAESLIGMSDGRGRRHRTALRKGGGWRGTEGAGARSPVAVTR